jgi:hypothetical protein
MSWHRFRWLLSLAISHVAWRVMPEPQRSRCFKDFADALEAIKRREGGSPSWPL